jgi:hypothetical protein
MKNSGAEIHWQDEKPSAGRRRGRSSFPKPVDILPSPRSEFNWFFRTRPVFE